MTPATDLLAEIRRFLKHELEPDPSSSAAATIYKTRICVNLLGILEREAQLQPGLALLDAEVLAEAGLDPGYHPERSAAARLALALRDGAIALTPMLKTYLRRRSLLLLAINGPRYSGYAQAKAEWDGDTRWLEAQLDEYIGEENH